MCSFLSIELSNENGLGDFDSDEEKKVFKKPANIVQKSLNKTPTIDKYVFFVSSCQSVSRQIREDSTDRSTSSGYGSMPSTSSTLTESSNDSEKSLNFSVSSNSCVICSSTFNSISELMLHLEFRFSLTFVILLYLFI